MGKRILSRSAGIPSIIVGMNDLFSAVEAEAARLLFYFMAKRPSVNRERVKRAWLDANVGITETTLDAALDKVEAAIAELGSPDQKRWALYSIQRQYREFLDAIVLREEKVPDAANASISAGTSAAKSFRAKAFVGGNDLFFAAET
jgi:DNA helicase II / ATP-dependent DNA helicase PcrA